MAEEDAKKKEQSPDLGKWILVRYAIIVVCLLCLAGMIVFKACKTAFVEKDKWLALAKTQERPDRRIYPSRGNIYSHDGKLMATSVPRYYTFMDFKAGGFDKKVFDANLDSLAICLSHTFHDRTPAGYKAHLRRGYAIGSRYYPVVSKKISYYELKNLKAFPFFRMNNSNKTGLVVKEMVQREKPFGSLASRTIGDTYGEIDTSGVTKGKNGLELQYDSLLRGKPGWNAIRRLNGQWTNVTEEEPVEGMDIYSTIDIDIQDLTEKSLVDMLKSIDAASGTAVVMEVATGEIKAITNMGRVREGVYAETMNHAVADETEPGSTFKVASIMVALEDGVCQPGDTVDVGNGIYMYKGARMTDHNMHRGGYGKITVEQAIWYSSNIGVAKTILKGYANNPTKFVEGLYRIGMNANLKIDIPGAGRAKIRRPDDPNQYWSKTTLPWMSFGYETQIPPISTLAFYNAIANGGKMMRPYFVKEIKHRGKTVRSFSPEVLKQSICSTETLAKIQHMLVGVVDSGTGKAVHSDIIPIAGKTGTAQIASGGVYRRAGHQVAFAGYFPANDPQYSCIVVIRQPRIGYPSGGTMSGGVVKAIAEKIYASHIRVKVEDMERDSTAVWLPATKAGEKRAVEAVLDELDIQWADSASTHWVRAERDSSNIRLRNLKIIDGLVPSVYGMGAKDAVFLLENAGLRVTLSGAGRVTSQSIPPGRRVVKGQTILITLK